MRKALQECQFPTWILNQLQQNFEIKHNNNQETNQSNNSSNLEGNNSNNNNRNITIVVPYIQGIGEKFKKFLVCESKGIQVHFKGTNTLQTLLVKPKDKDNKLQKIGVSYHFKYPHINCPDEYIGESGKPFGERIKEHLKAPSPIHQHSSSTGHPLS